MGRRKKGIPINGWVILDKPARFGSTSAVSQIRRYFNAQKAGHGGTLDPFATGVLPIALGEATKTMPYILDSIKEYQFTINWGCETDTLDCDGISIKSSTKRPTHQEIIDILPEFIGNIQQKPPLYSSVKIDGRRAYDYARSGENPDLPIRTVHIEALTVQNQDNRNNFQENKTDFYLKCGKGTYVRSLARDLAYRLGTVSHVINLRRLRVGPFHLKDSWTLDHFSLEYLEQREDIVAHNQQLLPIEAALDGIPVMVVTETEARILRNGQSLSLVRKLDQERFHKAKSSDLVIAMMQDQNTDQHYITCIAHYDYGSLHPVRVFNF